MLDGLMKFKKTMTTALNGLLIVAVALLVACVVWGVLTRSVGELVVWLERVQGFNVWSWMPTGQAKWTEELARFLLIWVSLIGGAVAFGTKGHLGVDYFVDKFDPSMRKVMAVVSNLIVLFFAGAIFLYGGGRVVSDALAMEQMTPALGWKMGHVYLALPIAGVFTILFTLENLIEIFADRISGLDADPSLENAS